MSDTPRTLEALTQVLDRDGCLADNNAPFVLVRLAKTLERELNAAKAGIEGMKKPLLETSPDWQKARMLGRREAFNILMSCDPDDFTEEFMGSHSIADTGDYASHWLQDKLSALLDAANPSSLIERLNNSFYEQSYMDFAMRDAIQDAHALLKNLEHEGNEKGTRCMTCNSHCSEPHKADCLMGQALAKLQPFLK